MKTFALILLAFLALPLHAHAELRVIGVKVTKDPDSKVHVSIASDEAKEKKNDVTVEEAAKILRDAQGWGSLVMVRIVADGVSLQDYLPLMKAMAENPWLYESTDIEYPVTLTDPQNAALTRLASWEWYAPENPRELKESRAKRLAEWTTLKDSLMKLGLPRLSVSGDIQVTKETITNRSESDVLVVIAHETGRDIAHRAHWLKAGESIPNQSMFMGGSLPCHILWPNKEREPAASKDP